MEQEIRDQIMEHVEESQLKIAPMAENVTCVVFRAKVDEWQYDHGLKKKPKIRAPWYLKEPQNKFYWFLYPIQQLRRNWQMSLTIFLIILVLNCASKWADVLVALL